MGRALGRLEGKKREKRHVTSLQSRLDVVSEILVGAIEAAKKAGASKHQIAKMLERVASDLDDPI
jgi:DNA-binding transcriptional regulator YhcF (GntR family)